MSTATDILSRRGLAFLGTAAAAVLAVSVNVLANRFYVRWDVTSDRLFTLSAPTTETLGRLQQPVEVVVFLSRSDPLLHGVTSLLDAYRAESRMLDVRYVDPDRDPAEFIALQQRYGIFEGRTENGRLVTDASIVLASAERRWFITTDDLLVFDDEDGMAKPRLEQALTEGLTNLENREEISVCLSQGHEEARFDGGGQQGLDEFRRELEKSNFAVREVNLASPSPAETLEGCRLVVVAGPGIPFRRTATERLAAHRDAGGSLFLLVGPISDDEGRILDPNLEALLGSTGISFDPGLVFEGDDELRLPLGVGGEVFLATPREHAITRGFFRRGEPSERILLQLAQGLSLDSRQTAVPLLESSKLSFDIKSFRALSTGTLDDDEEAHPRVLAAAWEARSADGGAAGTSSRVVVVGTASVLFQSTYLDPGLLPTRRFVENAVNWLVARPALVSVPEKRGKPAGLDLTEATLEEVQRYVLLYMPIVVLLLGALVVHRRRQDLPD